MKDIDNPRFTAADVAAMTGINLKTIQNSTYRGLLNPFQDADEVEQAERGRRHIYTERNVLKFLCMAELERYGIGVPIGRAICRQALDGIIGKPGIMLVTRGKEGWNCRWMGRDDLYSDAAGGESTREWVEPRIRSTDVPAGIFVNVAMLIVKAQEKISAFLKTVEAES